MPVHVNDLITEVVSEDASETAAVADEAPRVAEPAGGDGLKLAHERLLREQLRTRAENFSD